MRILMLLIILIMATPVFGETRTVNAIIGEAENQGYEGMLAVACAIQNRGTLKGVYGEHAPRVTGKKYSKLGKINDSNGKNRETYLLQEEK